MSALNNNQGILSKFVIFWFPVIAYSAIIFYASSIEGKDAPLLFPHFDKVVHILEFAPFGFFLGRALNNSVKGLSKRSLIGLTIIFSCLYGVSDEIHQMFVPGRQAALLDLVADCVGAILGVWIYTLLAKE